MTIESIGYEPAWPMPHVRLIQLGLIVIALLTNYAMASTGQAMLLPAAAVSTGGAFFGILWIAEANKR